MPYTDLPERRHWSYAPVTWALLENVAAPISATRFAPKASCTRAEMVSFLWAASGRPEPEPQEMPFTDVPASAPYYKAVLWALENGITGGTSPNSFSPDMLCTRAQALTFLWRAAGSPKSDGRNESFDDVPSSKYYFSSVAWALQQHITSGTSARTSLPGAQLPALKRWRFSALKRSRKKWPPRRPGRATSNRRTASREITHPGCLSQKPEHLFRFFASNAPAFSFSPLRIRRGSLLRALGGDRCSKERPRREVSHPVRLFRKTGAFVPIFSILV